MNRKEGIIVVALLITTFFGSAFAAPAIQNIMILNDPLNVRIVGGTLSLRTTSMDIHVLGPQGVYALANGPLHFNIVEAFSFAPDRGFVQVDSVLITIAYQHIESSPGDMFSVSLNGQSSGNVEIQRFSSTVVVGSLLKQHLRPASNLVEISLVQTNPVAQVQLLVFEVRLTVDYTFMA